MTENKSMECSKEDLEKYLNEIPYYVYIKDSNEKVVYENELHKNNIYIENEKMTMDKIDEMVNVEYDNNKGEQIKENVLDIISKHISEVIGYETNRYDAEITEKSIFNELMKSLKKELESENVFFLLYIAEQSKFVNYNDSYNEIESNIGKHLNNYITNNNELTKENIKRILSNNPFFDKYKIYVSIEELAKGILGIMIYKYEIDKKYDISTLNMNQRFIDETCNVIKLISRINILYQRYDKELELRKNSEVGLKQFVETATDLCCIIKIKDNKCEIIEMTDSWRNLFGSFEKIINKEELEKYVHKDDLRKYKEEVKEKVYNNIEADKIHTIELRNKTRDGSYRNIVWKWKYTIDKVFVISGNDVTNKKIFEHEKLKLEKEINREKINKKFFTNISVQFKNPINEIIYALQLLESYTIHKRHIPWNKAKKYIDLIEKNSYMLLKWSNDLIEISKLESRYNEFTLDKINIVEEIENIIDYTNQHFYGVINNIIFDTVSEEIFTGCDLKKTEKVIFIILDKLIHASSKKANIKVKVLNTADEYAAIFFQSDRFLVTGNRLDDAINFFDNDTDTYMEDSGAASTIRLRLSLLKKYIRLINGKIKFDYAKGNITIKLSIPIINLDNHKPEFLNQKLLNSLAEKCNIEYADTF